MPGSQEICYYPLYIFFAQTILEDIQNFPSPEHEKEAAEKFTMSKVFAEKFY